MLDDTTVPNGLFTEDGGVARCVWCRATPAYQHYHDHEWGVPRWYDTRLFEKICLEFDYHITKKIVYFSFENQIFLFNG